MRSFGSGLIMLGALATMLGAAIGFMDFIDTLNRAESAPQQAAGAAMAIAWATIPYCFTRAVAMITQNADATDGLAAIEAMQQTLKDIRPEAATKKNLSSN